MWGTDRNQWRAPTVRNIVSTYSLLAHIAGDGTYDRANTHEGVGCRRGTLSERAPHTKRSRMSLTLPTYSGGSIENGDEKVLIYIERSGARGEVAVHREHGFEVFSKNRAKKISWRRLRLPHPPRSRPGQTTSADHHGWDAAYAVAATPRRS